MHAVLAEQFIRKETPPASDNPGLLCKKREYGGML